jgi:hypothetical protein
MVEYQDVPDDNIQGRGGQEVIFEIVEPDFMAAEEALKQTASKVEAWDKTQVLEAKLKGIRDAFRNVQSETSKARGALQKSKTRLNETLRSSPHDADAIRQKTETVQSNQNRLETAQRQESDLVKQIGMLEQELLTEAVRHRPYSIILFDEIEKAHPEVFNILLQVLDEGRMTDGKGRVVNFKNTIIIMTSNIGSQFIEKMESIGFSNTSEKEDYMNVKDKVMESLKDHFRPEFLNRIDEIVLFDILSKEAILEIVKLRIKVVKERIESKGIYFDINNEALEYLALEGYNPHYGARPLNRLIQNKILNPLANLMIGNNVRKGDSVSIGIKNNELNIITKKGKIKSNLKIKSRLKA